MSDELPLTPKTTDSYDVIISHTSKTKAQSETPWSKELPPPSVMKWKDVTTKPHLGCKYHQLYLFYEAFSIWLPSWTGITVTRTVQVFPDYKSAVCVEALNDSSN